MTTLVETTQHPATVFWRYWTATTTSQIGSAVTSVALPLAALVLLDASAFQIGLLVAAGDLGWLLLTLPAGALATHLPLLPQLADEWHSRRHPARRPPGRGLVVQLLGAPVALLVDALSCLVSGALMWTLLRAERPDVVRTPMVQQIREGWRYVVEHPLMRPMMSDATATNFAAGMLLTLTPLYVVRELGASPTA